MAYVVTLWIAVFMALTCPVGAQEAAATAPSVAASKGGLVMDVQGAADESAKRVAVTMQPNGQGRNVSGIADVIGFPFIENGSWSDVDWKVDGSNVTGSIMGKDGHVVGNFEGTITATGMSGKVTHVDGRVGLWSWDGPLPH